MKAKILILAGGCGTRLWPLSTDEKPKQFQSFFDDRTLLQMAYDRIGDSNPDDIYVSTNKRYKLLVKEQLPDVPFDNIIAEPSRRDTGPCIAFAMKYIKDQSGGDSIVTIINADQLIKKPEKFRSVMNASQKIADQSDQLVLVSVETKFPNPNLGYIKVGSKQQVTDGISVFQLDQFVEKPDLKSASKYHRAKNYYWNTAIFTWKIDTFLYYLKQYSDDIHTNLQMISDYKNCKDEYDSFPKISIDYALLEKMSPEKLAVIPADLGWSDVGTWKTMFDESPKDKYSNLVKGKFRYSNVKNSVLINETNNEAVAYNLENKFYIITKNTSIVGDLDDSNRLKNIVKTIS